MCSIRNLLLAISLLTFGAGNTYASHILAGGLTYKFIDSSGGHYHYKIALTLYQDCNTGQPEAIAQDNPAFFTIYNGGTTPFMVDTAVYYTSASMVPVDYTTPCGTFSSPVTGFCAMQKIFEKDYYLPPSASGYTVAYQRCCRSASVANIIDPGDKGITYFCEIPPMHTVNTSSVFTKNPPLLTCLSNTLVYDLSATDADGDSLSYELSQCYEGTTSDIKPVVVAPPPYDPVSFVSSSSFTSPMGSTVPLTYNPVSGWLTVTPDHLGLYVIGISCHEWRGGVLINTTRMEFNCLVVNCASGFYSTLHPFAGNDTVILTGDSVQFNATGGTSYTWEPATYLNNAAIYDPVGIYTVPGSITYILHAVNDSGCTGMDTVIITVIDHAEYRVPNGFTPNGDGVNDRLMPIPLKNAVMQSFKIFDRSGRLLYEGKSAHDGWDGRYNGKVQPLGAYTWELQYNDEKGIPRRQTGSVTLVQ